MIDCYQRMLSKSRVENIYKQIHQNTQNLVYANESMLFDHVLVCIENEKNILSNEIQKTLNKTLKRKKMRGGI